MTSDHVIFIPAILAVGFVLGFIIGRKTLLTQLEAKRDAMRRRKDRRKAQQAEETSSSEVLPESSDQGS